MTSTEPRTIANWSEVFGDGFKRPVAVYRAADGAEAECRRCPEAGNCPNVQKACCGGEPFIAIVAPCKLGRFAIEPLTADAGTAPPHPA